MQRRLPKRGFRRPFLEKVIAINVSALERFDAKSQVDEKALREARLVQGHGAEIKILGAGELRKALTVVAHSFSPSARLKIEAAGGRVVEIKAETEATPAAT
jgi:large subunit ribosomal protein L15